MVTVDLWHATEGNTPRGLGANIWRRCFQAPSSPSSRFGKNKNQCAPTPDADLDLGVVLWRGDVIDLSNCCKKEQGSCAPRMCVLC